MPAEQQPGRGGGSEMAASAQPVTPEVRQRVRRMLLIGQAMSAVAISTSITASQSIWMRVCKNDIAFQARHMGRLSGIIAVVALFWNPFYASIIDTFGRRPLLFLAPLLQTFGRAIVVAGGDGNQTLTSMSVYMVIAASAQPAIMLAQSTVLADIFGKDPAALGGAQASIMIPMSISTIFMPMIGARLARQGLHYPFTMGMLLAACNALFMFFYMPETLQPHERKEFKLRLPNPFAGPLKLLQLRVPRTHPNSGRDSNSMPSLWTLVLMRVVSGLTDIRAVAQSQNLYKIEYLGWGMSERASFMSASGIVSLPGYFGVGTMLRSFGTLSSLRIGAVGHALQALLWALSTSSWHFYALLPFGWLRYLCASSLDVCLTQQADAAGMGKGELRGALGNVSQLVNVFAPLLWANVFSYGIRHKQQYVFYGTMSIIALSNAGLSFVPRGRGEEERKKPDRQGGKEIAKKGS